MLSAEECKKRAADCDRLAAEAQVSTRRNKLLALAQQWTRLATRTEQFGPVAMDKMQDPRS
jgi:hypothetical protein